MTATSLPLKGATEHSGASLWASLGEWPALQAGAGARTLHAFRKAEVAQVSNLLCRRLSAFAARHSAASARRRPVGRCWNVQALADWKSAIQQTGSLRYQVPSAHDPCKVQANSTHSKRFAKYFALGRLLGFLIMICLAATPAFAASLLLTGATVHTISGETFTPGQVLIQDGKIVAVGTTVSGNGAEAIDLTGLHLYPGLIALDSVLGLTEISGVRATQDATEVGDYRPDVESWIAVNPDSELIPVARANGIAYFEPVPQGGVISGQSGLVSVEGWTMEERTFKKPLALHLFWPSMELNLAPRERAREKSKPKSPDEQAKERRTKVRATADFFEESRAYAKAKDAAAKGGVPAPELVPAWEAMLPYVRGELPIMIHADEIRQIRSAVDWASTNHYKLILAGGRDAWMAANLLATNKIPVIYGNAFTLPSRDIASYDVQFSAPDVLHKAGVQVVFSFGSNSFDAPLARNLPYSAAQAVAFGLPEAEALKGLTLYPAQLAGVADRLGSIDPGKEATLFAADGNILDIRSNVKRMWVSGNEVSLETRHTRLYEKYKNRPRAQ